MRIPQSCLSCLRSFLFISSFPGQHPALLPLLGCRSPFPATKLTPPPAAGKTTLLDVLAGRRSGQGVTGRIHINGNKVTAHQLRDSVG